MKDKSNTPDLFEDDPFDPQSLHLPAQKRFDPAQFFVNKDRLARLAILNAACSNIGILVCAVLIWLAWQRPPIYIVLGASGDVVAVRGSSFVGAKGLHVEQSLLATAALLSRNPKDFDLPEILESMFLKSARGKAQALKMAESAEFRDKQIQQKPVIFKIDALETRPDFVRVLVTGELERAGIIHNEAFVEPIPFTLGLTFVANPDLLRNRRQPTLVYDFQMKVNHEKAP